MYQEEAGYEIVEQPYQLTPTVSEPNNQPQHSRPPSPRSSLSKLKSHSAKSRTPPFDGSVTAGSDKKCKFLSPPPQQGSEQDQDNVVVGPGWIWDDTYKRYFIWQQMVLLHGKRGKAGIREGPYGRILSSSPCFVPLRIFPRLHTRQQIRAAI